MINEASASKLIAHENFILIPSSQRSQVEAILKEYRCSGEWSANVGDVQAYSSNNHEVGEVAIWTLWLGSADYNNIQSTLNKLEL